MEHLKRCALTLKKRVLALKKRGRPRRFTASLLCVCMVLSLCEGLKLLIPTAYAAGEPGTSGVTRQADPSTMDTYQKMLDFSENTRYPGRQG